MVFLFVRPSSSSLFPYTTLFRSYLFIWLVLFSVSMVFGERGHVAVDFFARLLPRPVKRVSSRDRKSTRLNSSHVAISYAVFCLKQKIDSIHSIWIILIYTC